MAFSILSIRDALQTQLATISGLRVHDTVPGSITPPAAIVAPAPGVFLAYDDTMDGAAEVDFVVTLLVSAGSDRAGQDALDAFLTSSGASSIKAAVEASPTLGGTVHFVQVGQARAYGLHEWADIQYLGVEFLVTVGVL